MSVLQLRDVSKHYMVAGSAVPVLSNISFGVDKAEVIAITGASGSGKSTLLNIIGLLDVPSSGEVEIAGEATQTLQDNARASMRNQYLGFIFQQFYLLPRLTVFENILLPMTYANVPHDLERAQDLLRQVGMLDHGNKFPAQLSGGQQQRVAIARALINRPALLLADEPTGSLDTVTSQQVMNLMLEMNQRFGTTLLIVTHDTLIADQCSRKILLRDGQICD